MKRAKILIPGILLLLLLLPANVFWAIRLFRPAHDEAGEKNVPGPPYYVKPSEEDPANTFTCKTPKGRIHCTSGGRIIFSLTFYAYAGEVLDVMEFDQVFVLGYNDFYGLDFNKDFIFDMFRRNGRYYIAVDRDTVVEFDRKYFPRHTVVGRNGKTYGWDGGKWVILP